MLLLAQNSPWISYSKRMDLFPMTFKFEHTNKSPFWSFLWILPSRVLNHTNSIQFCGFSLFFIFFSSYPRKWMESLIKWRARKDNEFPCMTWLLTQDDLSSYVALWICTHPMLLLSHEKTIPINLLTNIQWLGTRLKKHGCLPIRRMGSQDNTWQ